MGLDGSLLVPNCVRRGRFLDCCARMKQQQNKIRKMVEGRMEGLVRINTRGGFA